MPSTFILKLELVPLAIFMEDMRMVPLFLLYILNCLVTEPMVVKTVSKRTELAEKSSLADVLVIILLSLLQEKAPTKKETEKKVFYLGFT